MWLAAVFFGEISSWFDSMGLVKFHHYIRFLNKLIFIAFPISQDAGLRALVISKDREVMQLNLTCERYSPYYKLGKGLIYC